MAEDDLCSVGDLYAIGMVLVSVFALEIDHELLGFVLAAFPECRFLLLLDFFVEEELVVEVEVALGDNLEEGLPVEVDFVIVIIGLVVDIGIGESAWLMDYPFEMMSPFISFSGTVLTPCSRSTSPHLIFSWAYDIQDIS